MAFSHTTGFTGTTATSNRSHRVGSSASFGHIYNGFPFDSETIEKPFIEALERQKDMKLYIRLPSWFTIATAISAYNPD